MNERPGTDPGVLAGSTCCAGTVDEGFIGHGSRSSPGHTPYGGFTDPGVGNEGFESYEPTGTLNHEFEYKLARTVAFDHAKRLSYGVANTSGEDPPVEYCETDASTVDYVLRNDGLVLPFVLSYHPHTGDAEDIATSFDPSVGKHQRDGTEELLDIDYEAPYRFVVADSLPNEVTESESLVVERDGVPLCYIPYWLFLLIC